MGHGAARPAPTMARWALPLLLFTRARADDGCSMCEGLTCDAYSAHTCMVVERDFGCQCAGCGPRRGTTRSLGARRGAAHVATRRASRARGEGSARRDGA